MDGARAVADSLPPSLSGPTYLLDFALANRRSGPESRDEEVTRSMCRRRRRAAAAQTSWALIILVLVLSYEVQMEA